MRDADEGAPPMIKDLNRRLGLIESVKAAWDTGRFQLTENGKHCNDWLNHQFAAQIRTIRNRLYEIESGRIG